MSLWYTYDEENVDIDLNSGDVDIYLGHNDDGNIYLSIPIADLVELGKLIVKRKNEIMVDKSFIEAGFDTSEYKEVE